MPVICDPANCPTGKRVDDAINAISGLRQDLAYVRKDYRDAHKAHSDIHGTLIEQTTTLGHVISDLEQDRMERKELYQKAEDTAVALEGKADKDKTISRGGVVLLISILGILFVAMTFVITAANNSNGNQMPITEKEVKDVSNDKGH